MSHGLMVWKEESGNQFRVLYVKNLQTVGWVRYNTVSKLADNTKIGMSQGWSTYQFLLKQGYRLIPESQMYTENL